MGSATDRYGQTRTRTVTSLWSEQRRGCGAARLHGECRRCILAPRTWLGKRHPLRHAHAADTIRLAELGLRDDCQSYGRASRLVGGALLIGYEPKPDTDLVSALMKVTSGLRLGSWATKRRAGWRCLSCRNGAVVSNDATSVAQAGTAAFCSARALCQCGCPPSRVPTPTWRRRPARWRYAVCSFGCTHRWHGRTAAAAARAWKP